MLQPTLHVTHLVGAQLPADPHSFKRILYFVKKDPDAPEYFLGKGERPYSTEQVQIYVESKHATVLKKPVELTPDTELYWGNDGRIYKGPFLNPQLADMEALEIAA